MNIREMVYENTRALAKLNHRKISDIEREIGVSAGYLSRVKRGFSIEHVAKLAQIFSVTIDDMTYGNYWEKYKQDFAVNELKDAIRRAQKSMTDRQIHDVVEKYLETW